MQTVGLGAGTFKLKCGGGIGPISPGFTSCVIPGSYFLSLNFTPFIYQTMYHAVISLSNFVFVWFCFVFFFPPMFSVVIPNDCWQVVC